MEQNYIELSISVVTLISQTAQDWDRQHQWLCEQLEIFHKSFLTTG